jgi:outer membrane protein assembly factor BamB
MTLRSLASLFALTASALAMSACGGAAQTSAFSPDWQSDDGRSIAAVVNRVGTVPDGNGLALGITQTQLIGIWLDGSHRWKHTASPDSRPSIAGGIVAYTSGGNLVALDAHSGNELWKVAVGDKRLRGAGDDGTTTVASLGSNSGGGTLLLAVNRSGAVVRKWTPEVEVGIPAIAGGLVFAPWGSQYVSALELGSGSEAGRVLARTVVSRAIGVGGSLYFGENALVRFDSAITGASRNGAHVVKLPERELPGKPTWYPDGAAVLPKGAGAPDSIRFYARPQEVSGALALDSDRFAATYFKIVVGFNGHDGSLRWVHTFPEEIIGGDATVGGFALCDEKGTVWFVDGRSGGESGHAAIGEPVQSCVVNGGSFAVKSGGDTGSVSEQITQAIELRESTMATIQRFLLRELGTGDDAQVTKTLLELASDARTQPELLSEARDLLAARRTGVDFMLEAVNRHYDFLSDQLRPPPVGPLADALAAVGEKRAAAPLAAHLNDPADTPNDVRRAAHALVRLATPSELPAVRMFFSLYRATADEDDLVAAVIDAAKILVTMAGPEGSDIVRRAAEDPLTHQAVREGIVSLVPKKG